MSSVSTTDRPEPGTLNSADPPEPPEPVGLVPDEGRGSLPYALLRGDSLVATASWALQEAEVELLDFTVTWEQVQELERPLVLHDPLCPLTPVDFLREAVASATRSVVVAVRPVTDTIKTASATTVGETLDREKLWTVTSPVVLPAAVVAELPSWPDTGDFAVLAESLRDRFEVRFVEAPALARRVEDESELQLLEAFADEHG